MASPQVFFENIVVAPTIEKDNGREQGGDSSKAFSLGEGAEERGG